MTNDTTIERVWVDGQPWTTQTVQCRRRDHRRAASMVLDRMRSAISPGHTVRVQVGEAMTAEVPTYTAGGAA